MSTESDPIVDNWYFHLDKGQRFMVVAVDKEKGAVDIQNFDGGLDEVSLSAWYDMDIELSEAPENWSGATDIAELDDFGTEITDTRPGDWSEPLQEFRKPDQERVMEPEESEDDWGEGHIREEPLEGEE
ncbi:MAG: hypothetical protein KAS48_02520 [Gammaproteobacteria bacterium]|nr:hypothetical protein [Gammaproteobacteria bacterium]MCK5091652.1 hypothetical protein [Gammaproteobacteria bacterium]